MFSIIICTYNPEPKNFRRLLQAIIRFKRVEIDYEVIVVDNNSPMPVAEMKSVKEFLQEIPDAKIIIEKKPGLTNARINGALAAKGNWLVWFDDDNEPMADYLICLKNLFDQYTEVGCWGPGEITVEYVDDTKDKFMNGQKYYFQERYNTGIAFDNNPLWQTCYPYGTGLVVRKDIMQKYMERVQAGSYSLNDRKGKSLSSGGDVQIILTGIKMGYAAGVSDTLKLNHLIHADKANYGYLLKLIYGTAASSLPAYNQVFNEQKITPVLPGNYKIVKYIYGILKLNLFKKSLKEILINITQTAGEIRGAFDACNKNIPAALKLFQFLISYK